MDEIELRETGHLLYNNLSYKGPQYYDVEPRFVPLLSPPDSGQSKFDQVLEWAREQAEKK